MGTVTVGATAMRLVDANPERTRLHIFALSATGLNIGLDESMSADKVYFLSQYKDVLLQTYKGEVWAKRPGVADVSVSFFEE